MTKNDTVLKLFREGRYQECSSLIQNIVKDKPTKSKRNPQIVQLCSDSNLFVSDQLAEDWESPELQHVAQKWEKGMLRALDIHRSLRYLQLCTTIPHEITLCIIHNTLLWAVMKVDPFLQHKSILNDTFHTSLLALRCCTSAFGGYNMRRPCDHRVEEFVYLGHQIIPHLQEFPPDQCQILIDILILFIILTLDEICDEEFSFTEDCIKLIETLAAASSLTRIHVSSFKPSDKSQRIYPKLFKFGFCCVGEIFDNQYSLNSLSSSLDVIHIVGAIISLRVKQFENSLRYLKAVEASRYLFLSHYLKGLVELELHNINSCLYHVSCAPTTGSSFFMQARLHTLKGQALLTSKKPKEALKSLQQINYIQKEVHLPIAAFLTSQAYGELGNTKQQIEILSLLVECLSAESPVQPMLISPLVGLEHCLLLATHPQPEISYVEALYACAATQLTIQPKTASDHLIELLRHMKFKSDTDIRNILKRTSSVKGLVDLLHDTACALLESGSAAEAQLLCQACREIYQDRLGFVAKENSGLSNLKEDVIALLLLGEAQTVLDSSDSGDTFNMCAKSIHNFLEGRKEASNTGSDEDVILAKKLLTRVYLLKAQLNIKRDFSDDAVACFQRAINFNPDDPEVLLSFADFLLNSGQADESLAVWTMYKERRIYPAPENPSLKYLLGDKMLSSKKEGIIARLQSLIEQ